MAPTKRSASKAFGTIGFKTTSSDGKYLKKLLMNGKISHGCPPREILQSFPHFKNYKPNSFRSGLRHLKTVTGFNVRSNNPMIDDEAEEDDYDYTDPFLAEEEDDDECIPHHLVCPTSLVAARKQSLLPLLVHSRATVTRWSLTTSMPGMELVVAESSSHELSWVPCYIISKYLASDVKTWHVHILILVPSGVGSKNTDDIKLRLENDANTLAVIITWPNFLVDMLFLTLFSKEEQFSKDFVLHEQAIKQCMSEMHPTKNDPLKSVARIPLPFQVEPNIRNDDWRYLGDKASARVLFIDLKAPYDGSYEGQTVKDVVTLNDQILQEQVCGGRHF